MILVCLPSTVKVFGVSRNRNCPSLAGFGRVVNQVEAARGGVSSSSYVENYRHILGNSHNFL
jgi:hypothetical protein